MWRIYQEVIAQKYHKKLLILNIVKHNNRKSAEQIKDHFNRETGLQVSTDTVRIILHEINIFSVFLLGNKKFHIKNFIDQQRKFS